VKPAASSDKQSESRAEHVAAKAKSPVRQSGWAEGLGGVLGAARAEGEVRNSGGPSAPPASGKDRPYKPKAKAVGAQRESEGAIVPTKAVQKNAADGRGPCFGRASDGGKSEGMAQTAASKHPGGLLPIDKVRRLQKKLYVAAKGNTERRFHALYDRVHRGDVLWEAWRRVRRNKGAAGVDGVTLAAVEQYGVEKMLKELGEALQRGTYEPPPVLRRYIPKNDGKLRPLGIPTVADRVAQQAMKLVLEPIFEADFKASSYGFRPRRSAVQALETIRETVNAGCNHVLDADIRDYFGSIDHELLMERVERRVSDRRVLKLLRKWLQAGSMEEGRQTETVSGTPQGGVISPLLSNIYLHFLDAVWERQCAGIGVLVRYADDFVVVCRSREAIEEAERRVRIILGRLKLDLHPEKTRKVELDAGKEGFDFLGCHLHKRMSGRLLEMKGVRRYYLQRWPSARSIRRVRSRIHELTDRRRQGVGDVREVIANLNPVLRGWGNYFCNGNAALKFNQVDSYVYRRLHHFMAQRKGRKLQVGQADEWTREWFWDKGLPRLRGTVRYPKPCMLPDKTIGKPYAGNPHVRFERRMVETGRI
jgi:RNA-directed DNA polymerase